jgi:hypothetical protein
LGAGTAGYIEVRLEDIEAANRIAHEVLGRSLDELPPQTRRLLDLLKELVQEKKSQQGEATGKVGAGSTCVGAGTACCFTRREVRDFTGWTEFQVRAHLQKLTELEYVLAHHGRQGTRFVYELLYDGAGEEGSPRLCGLVDPRSLKTCGYDADFEPRSSPLRGAFEPASCEAQNPLSPAPAAAPRVNGHSVASNAVLRG